MKKLFLALLLCLSLGVSANAAIVKPNVYEVAYIAQIKYEMWFDACTYGPYSCVGVDLPKIILTNMRKGLFGYYDGGDMIYIRYGLVGSQMKEVVLHEMLHYLQAQVGGLIVPGPAKEICEAENEVFTLVDQWALDHGYTWLVVGPNWWKPYTHCWRWYDPKWDSYSLIDKLIWSLDGDI